MYRIASIAAYDVMETVVIAATVRLWDGLQVGAPTSEFTCRTTIQGVGSAEDEDWLRDVLVGLIEAL